MTLRVMVVLTSSVVRCSCPFEIASIWNVNRTQSREEFKMKVRNNWFYISFLNDGAAITPRQNLPDLLDEYTDLLNAGYKFLRATRNDETHSVPSSVICILITRVVWGGCVLCSHTYVRVLLENYQIRTWIFSFWKCDKCFFGWLHEWEESQYYLVFNISELVQEQFYQ